MVTLDLQCSAARSGIQEKQKVNAIRRADQGEDKRTEGHAMQDDLGIDEYASHSVSRVLDRLMSTERMVSEQIHLIRLVFLTEKQPSHMNKPLDDALREEAQALFDERLMQSSENCTRGGGLDAVRADSPCGSGGLELAAASTRNP